MSYRVVLWHVADVPGVQVQLEAWKLRGLEAWRSHRGWSLGALGGDEAEKPWLTTPPVARRGVLFSVLCSPFSGARQRPLFFVSFVSAPQG